MDDPREPAGPAACLQELEAWRVGAAGFALFGLASLACAVARSIEVLLVARAAQAVSGAAGLVAVFSLLVEPGGTVGVRASWLRAAVLARGQRSRLARHRATVAPTPLRFAFGRITRRVI